MSTSDTPNAPKALIPVGKPAKPAKLSMGQLAAQVDPAELDADIIEKREALSALADDPTMPETTRNAIRALAALASPTKPGLEEVVAEWKMPRALIVQPTSRSEAKPEAALPGAIYTTSGQILPRPWQGIPLYIHEENVNFPENGKNPICQAPDAKLGSPFGDCYKCPHLPMGKQPGGFDAQKKTDCHNNITVVMLAADLSQVYTVQFGKTSRKAGGVILQLASQQPTLWTQSYGLQTEKKTADVGLYYIYKIEPSAVNNTPDVQRLCEALYGLIIAERRRFLANWYARPVRAAMVAAEAEGTFALDVALAGEEPDLTSPVTPTSSSRSTSDPM